MTRTPEAEKSARQTAGRQALMRICSQASEDELAYAIVACGGAEDAVDMRAAETGLVMVRGRIGGDGRPFNIGEATVTRAAVRLKDGAVGYSYILGREGRRARLAAIVDALGQDPARRECLETALVAPITKRVEAEVCRIREQTAATRASFFTLVRGED